MRTRELLFLTVTLIGGLGLFGALPAALFDDAPDIPGYMASAKPELPFEATGPVATIDGVEIPAARFNLEVERMVSVYGGRVNRSMLESYKTQILDRLVEEHLFAMLIEQKKVSLTEKELDEKLREFKSMFPSPASLKDYMRRVGFDEASLREELRKQATRQKLLEEHHSVRPTPKEIRAYYDKNLERFTLEAQVRASHILLKIDKDASDEEDKKIKRKAAGLAKMARKEGSDFAALARSHSEGPSATRGGDLGLFQRNRMVEPFADAAFGLKPGEVSDPVRTQFGWHVIKVFERQEERVQPFGEVEGKIGKTLLEQKSREVTLELMKKLEKKHEIVLHQENIKDNP